MIRFSYFGLTLVLGFCLGVYSGVNEVQVVTENTPSKTMFDLIALIFTVLGGGATFIATIFAVYVYSSWKVQQKEIELMGLRKNINENLSELESILILLVNSLYIYKNTKENGTLYTQYSQVKSKLDSNIRLYYSMRDPESNNEQVQSMIEDLSCNDLGMIKQTERLMSRLMILFYNKSVIVFPSYIVLENSNLSEYEDYIHSFFIDISSAKCEINNIDIVRKVKASVQSSMLQLIRRS